MDMYNQPSPPSWVPQDAMRQPMNMQQPQRFNIYQPQPAPYNQPTMPQAVPNTPPTSTMVQQPTSAFIGRYIDDIGEVMLDEVPMNGNIALFPTRDANAIYLKVWNQNGKLLTVRYIMDPDQSMPSLKSGAEDPMQQVYARLSKLEDALSKTQQQRPAKQQRGKDDLNERS